MPFRVTRLLCNAPWWFVCLMFKLCLGFRYNEQPSTYPDARGITSAWLREAKWWHHQPIIQFYQQLDKYYWWAALVDTVDFSVFLTWLIKMWNQKFSRLLAYTIIEETSDIGHIYHSWEYRLTRTPWKNGWDKKLVVGTAPYMQFMMLLS
jgi:hypothetical protein